MITYDKMGGRTIQLFLPFEFGKKKVRSITFSPVRLDHTLRWRNGEWKGNIVSLMAALSKQPEELIREIAYPDADRVMAVFFDMLPPEIRDSIGQQPAQQEQSIEATMSEPLPPPGSPIIHAPMGEADDPHRRRFEMDLPTEEHPPLPPLDEPSDALGLGVDLNA